MENKANYLLMFKETLTIAAQEEIIQCVKKHREDIIVVFGENVEFHKLDV